MRSRFTDSDWLILSQEEIAARQFPFSSSELVINRDTRELRQGPGSTFSECQKVGFVGAGPCGSHILFVDASADASRALKGRVDRPFASITAAKAAAVAGDLIWVWPGTYTDTDVLKDEVNLHFCPGARIDAADAEHPVMTDHGEAVRCQVGGALEASLACSVSNGEPNGAYRLIHVSGTGSMITVTCRSLNCTMDDYQDARVMLQEAGTVRLRTETASSNGSAVVEKLDGHADIEMTSTEGPATAVSIEKSGSVADRIRIGYADVMESVVYNSGVEACNIVAHVGANRSDATGPVFYVNDGALIATAGKLHGLLTSTGAGAQMVIDAGSAQGGLADQGLIGCDGGELVVRVGRIRSAGMLISATEDAVCRLHCDDARTTLNAPCVGLYNTAVVVLSGRFKATANTAMAHDWSASAALELDGCTVEVGSGASASFTATGARTLLAKRSTVNKALGAKVTAVGDLHRNSGTGPTAGQRPTANADGTWSWA